MPELVPEFLSQTDIDAHARSLFEESDDTQSDLAAAIGAHQPEVSRALKGENREVARRIVEHYTGKELEPGYALR